VLYAPDAPTAQTAAQAAFRRIASLNDTLSDYDSDSELSRLSHSSGQGKAVPVSTDLWVVLERAQQLSQRTDGAFDVTVGPMVNLWRKARRERKLPRADLLEQARQAVGWQKMLLDPKRRTATLLAPNMRLDLGAIAKGYATDQALQVLRGFGLPRALVAGGGDMTAGEAPPGKTGWRIEVAPLDVASAPPSRFVFLKNAGLATSGDLFQHVEIDGVRYSHIVDPRTGVGLTDHSLVTVIAPDGVTADSLATAASVLRPPEALKLIEAVRGAELLILRQPGTILEVHQSRGFNRLAPSK
jgi:thiamine biosynthesis lipoprotein